MSMIKRFAIKKIMITSFCLILLIMFYFFPTHEDNSIEVLDNKNKASVVYLLDKDNYVSRVIVYFDECNIVDEIKNKIEVLINGDNFFLPLIPKYTKINSIKVDKNKVYIDFSKEILSVNKYMEESMLEAIVYSITEINGIDEVYISVEGNKLLKSPNFNHNLNYPLTREYGINKEYNLTTFDNIVKTTIYFSKEEDDIIYYVPVTKIDNSKDEKVEIIIEELKSVVNAQNNLDSHLNDNAKLIDFDITNNKMNLVFNDYLLSNNELDSELECIISSSIFENYNVSEIIFNTLNNKNISIVNKKY